MLPVSFSEEELASVAKLVFYKSAGEDTTIIWVDVKLHICNGIGYGIAITSAVHRSRD
jgi:hypothetical protein